MKLICTNPSDTLTLGKEYDVGFLKKNSKNLFDKVDEYSKADKVYLVNDNGVGVVCSRNRFDQEEGALLAKEKMKSITSETAIRRSVDILASRKFSQLLSKGEVQKRGAGRWFYKSITFLSTQSLINHLKGEIREEIEKKTTVEKNLPTIKEHIPIQGFFKRTIK